MTGFLSDEFQAFEKEESLAQEAQAPKSIDEHINVASVDDGQAMVGTKQNYGPLQAAKNPDINETLLSNEKFTDVIKDSEEPVSSPMMGRAGFGYSPMYDHETLNDIELIHNSARSSKEAYEGYKAKLKGKVDVSYFQNKDAGTEEIVFKIPGDNKVLRIPADHYNYMIPQTKGRMVKGVENLVRDFFIERGLKGTVSMGKKMMGLKNAVQKVEKSDIIPEPRTWTQMGIDFVKPDLKNMGIGSVMAVIDGAAHKAHMANLSEKDVLDAYGTVADELRAIRDDAIAGGLTSYGMDKAIKGAVGFYKAGAAIAGAANKYARDLPFWKRGHKGSVEHGVFSDDKGTFDDVMKSSVVPLSEKVGMILDSFGISRVQNTAMAAYMLLHDAAEYTLIPQVKGVIGEARKNPAVLQKMMNTAAEMNEKGKQLLVKFIDLAPPPTSGSIKDAYHNRASQIKEVLQRSTAAIEELQMAKQEEASKAFDYFFENSKRMTSDDQLVDNYLDLTDAYTNAEKFANEYGEGTVIGNEARRIMKMIKKNSDTPKSQKNTRNAVNRLVDEDSIVPDTSFRTSNGKFLGGILSEFAIKQHQTRVKELQRLYSTVRGDVLNAADDMANRSSHDFPEAGQFVEARAAWKKVKVDAENNMLRPLGVLTQSFKQGKNGEWLYDIASDKDVALGIMDLKKNHPKDYELFQSTLRDLSKTDKFKDLYDSVDNFNDRIAQTILAEAFRMNTGIEAPPPKTFADAMASQYGMSGPAEDIAVAVSIMSDEMKANWNMIADYHKIFRPFTEAVSGAVSPVNPTHEAATLPFFTKNIDVDALRLGSSMSGILRDNQMGILIDALVIKDVQDMLTHIRKTTKPGETKRKVMMERLMKEAGNFAESTGSTEALKQSLRPMTERQLFGNPESPSVDMSVRGGMLDYPLTSDPGETMIGR